jgi:HD-GYP domain-containing protein (c-di-GMP phosphodiesterase class II)
MTQMIYKIDQQASDISTTYRKNRIERIYASADFDIGRYHFNADSFLYIDPTECVGMVRSYTVVSGRCIELQSQNILTCGDLLLVEEVESMTTLYMTEPSTILIHAQCPNSIDRMKKKSAEMIQLLSDLQTKDHYTKEHSDRVFEWAKKMGLALGYHSKQIYNLNKAARFHDVGKVFIADEILNKKEPLSVEEYKRIQNHVHLGESLILETYDKEVLTIIKQHHERIDGTGYPNGLVGNDILEEARVLAICDSFDAMTTDRVYKKGKSVAEAIVELRMLSGTLYDEVLVELFIKIIESQE